MKCLEKSIPFLKTKLADLLISEIGPVGKKLKTFGR